MKAVILAAGRGKRMGNLTKNIPKPLLKIRNKTLLEYKLSALPDDVTDVIIVIGYLGKTISDYLGPKFKKRKITYVYSKLLGTAYALWQAKHLLEGDFLVLSGDDLYTREDIKKCAKQSYTCLVSKTQRHGTGGSVKLDSKGHVVKIKEGDYKPGTLVATGLYFLNSEVFNLSLKKAGNSNNEYGLPQTILQQKKFPIHASIATAWHQISTPKDLNLSAKEVAVFS